MSANPFQDGMFLGALNLSPLTTNAAAEEL